jgi:hypothetical protein
MQQRGKPVFKEKFVELSEALFKVNHEKKWKSSALQLTTLVLAHGIVCDSTGRNNPYEQWLGLLGHLLFATSQYEMHL